MIRAFAWPPEDDGYLFEQDEECRRLWRETPRRPARRGRGPDPLRLHKKVAPANLGAAAGAVAGDDQINSRDQYITAMTKKQGGEYGEQ